MTVSPRREVMSGNVWGIEGYQGAAFRHPSLCLVRDGRSLRLCKSVIKPSQYAVFAAFFKNTKQSSFYRKRADVFRLNWLWSYLILLASYSSSNNLELCN